MGWKKSFETREKRINMLRDYLKKEAQNGSSPFIQKIVEDTKLPRSTVERYLSEYLLDEIESFNEGNLRKIKYIGVEK
jgi:hypothetical protein